MKIYSKQNCPNCEKAKRLLNSYSIGYEEVRADLDQSAQDFLVSKGLRGVPQVFVGDVLIGGYEKLFEYLMNEE